PRSQHGETARLPRRLAATAGFSTRVPHRRESCNSTKEMVMNAFKRTLIGLAVAAACSAGAAEAQVSDGVVKIGVLTDMSSLYTDLAGAGSVVAAKMAVEDSGIEKRGVKVEVISADHQNKPDVGSAVARQWY